MTSISELPSTTLRHTVFRLIVQIHEAIEIAFIFNELDLIVTPKKVAVFSLFYLFTNRLNKNLMFIGPCIIVIVEEYKTNLMSLAILFHFLCAQHASNINISIITSLQLCC